MATALKQAQATNQVGIGKGRVGTPPPHKPGAVGVPIKVAVFFDGTKNNRSNTTRRLKDANILIGQGKDYESSYANFYSNVSIMEELNQRRDPGNHEVSVYIEGIGTTDFVTGAVADGKPVKDEDNGNDDLIGYAIGSGTTGITMKVDKGIIELREKIAKAYSLANNEVIAKLTIDVVGFSRGAAAARHFVHRRKELLTGPKGLAWPQKTPPEIVINFVGLFDTVSSYERLKGASLEGGFYLGSLAWAPGPLGIPLNPHEISTDEMFSDDVLQLHLDMGSIPKKVVHLTAADEYRENFSLTNINTSLHAKVGFELTLPGVHSDIGGGYAEADPRHPRRELNQETRRIRDAAERRWLVAQGWYTDGAHGTENQFRPWREYTVLPAIPSLPVPVPLLFPLPPVILRTKPVPKQTVKIWENGVRYLTNEYQYVPLSIMLDFARKQGMIFTSQSSKYAVPARLANLCAYFTQEAKRLDGQGADRPPGSVTRQPQIACRSLAERNKLRNQYLHRSARLPSELKTGMAGRLDGGREGHHRHTIADDVLHEKAQDAVVRQTKEKATQLKDAATDRYEKFKHGTQHLYEQAKEEAKKDLHQAGEAIQKGAQQAEKVLEETGKAMQSMPPPLLF